MVNMKCESDEWRPPHPVILLTIRKMTNGASSRLTFRVQFLHCWNFQKAENSEFLVIGLVILDRFSSKGAQAKLICLDEIFRFCQKSRVMASVGYENFGSMNVVGSNFKLIFLSTLNTCVLWGLHGVCWFNDHDHACLHMFIFMVHSSYCLCYIMSYASHSLYTFSHTSLNYLFLLLC